MKVKSGDRVTFKGCMWDAHWEYDAPAVLYEPLRRYIIGGSIPSAIAQMVEDLCCDLADGENLEEGFHPDDLKEFTWRGWDPAGFATRKEAWHVTIEAEFFTDEEGELAFRLSEPKEEWRE